MDNIKDTLSNVTKSVFKTSKGLIKSTKLTLDLTTEESKLKTVYVEVGKKVHEIYAYGGSLGKYFDEKYVEILECERKIEALKKDLEQAKGTRACGKCSKSVSSSSEFCPKCGNKMGSGEGMAEAGEQRYDARYEGGNDRGDQRADYAEAPRTEGTPEPYGHQGSSPDNRPMKNCPVCGKENSAVNKFCASCGRTL